MGRRKDGARTPGLWIATNELPATGGQPFYQRLNQVLDTHAFDAFVEEQCAAFYASTIGCPSLMPGTYFRLLLIGYFEGIDSERGIAWRTADSLALRGFLGLGLDETPPEHSTISRTRRLIDVETHRAVFTWILQVLATADLIKGKTIGIDATTLEANAALRSIVRRDSGETYQEFLTRLAQASGIETPTRADLARLDRTRPKKGRNKDWRHPHDPDARITKMKDGRTHLAHKAEHAVDLETGAIVGVTVQGADQGDTTTIAETLTTAAEDLEAVATVTDGDTSVIDEVVADKGYHSNQVLVDLTALDLRTYIAEPARGRRTRCRRLAPLCAATRRLRAYLHTAPSFRTPLGRRVGNGPFNHGLLGYQIPPQDDWASGIAGFPSRHEPESHRQEDRASHSAGMVSTAPGDLCVGGGVSGLRCCRNRRRDTTERDVATPGP